MPRAGRAPAGKGKTSSWCLLNLWFSFVVVNRRLRSEPIGYECYRDLSTTIRGESSFVAADELRQLRQRLAIHCVAAFVMRSPPLNGAADGLLRNGLNRLHDLTAQFFIHVLQVQRPKGLCRLERLANAIVVPG